jgi:hypothetical protein
MSEQTKNLSTVNGGAAAAILSAGIGCIALALLSIAADKSIFLKNLFSIYKPTGALSGVTTAAIIVWLATWILLAIYWRNKNLSLVRINFIAFVFFGLSLLLTFPPVGDLL